VLVGLLVALAGCATSLRIAASPTVDTLGNWGAMATVTLALGQSYRDGAAAVLVAADVSGAVDARVGGHVGLGVGLDALGESRHFGFRMGLILDGRAILPSGAAGGAVGGRVGLLPVVKYRHVGRKPERCGDAESWTFWHLGLELSGRYLWGSDARGLFAAGPVFEIDALSTSACD
jgi:hypothetical protein